VRLARELIIKNNADFLVGTLTSAEAPAVSTIAKENKIVFLPPAAKALLLTAPANLHPYVFRVASNVSMEGEAGAIIMSKWQGIKRVATIAPDYAYGRDSIASYVAHMKQLRPDVEIVDDVLRDERRAERDVDGLVRELRELVERRDAVVRALRRRPHRPRTCRGLVAGASAAGARE